MPDPARDRGHGITGRGRDPGRAHPPPSSAPPLSGTRRPLMRVELLLSPDCPHAPAARAVLGRCLAALGTDLRVNERVGDFPSPTVLVDGVDVMGRHAMSAPT